MTLRCGDVTLGRDAVLDRAARLATVLADRGTGEGDIVSLLARNSVDVIVTHLAARRLDANVVPLPWRGTLAESRYVLDDSGARLLIGDADLVSPLAEGLPTLAFGDPLEAMLAAATPSTHVPLGLGGSIIYTSGTSGRPKGVKRLPSSPEQVGHRRDMLKIVYDGAPDNRALANGPLYHLFSLATAMTNFSAGGDVTIMPSFDPEECLRLIERDRITHTSFVPTMLVRLLRLPEAVRRKYDLGSLRHIVMSGAPCAPDVRLALIDWLGPVLHETYGSTETGVITQISHAEWLAHPGSVGRPVSTGEVRVYAEDGRRCAPGEVGDIYLWMHGTPDFTYLGDPGKREAMGRDGFVTVGDMGYLDEEGYLYVCDRRGDMVIVGGANVYPAEVEAVFLTHPDVVDVAVFGIPDPDYGELLVAHVALLPGSRLGEAELLAHLDGLLAKPKWPRRIVIDNELPRAENGKIIKRELRARYAGKIAA